jgi:hypothetical protein
MDSPMRAKPLGVLFVGFRRIAGPDLTIIFPGRGVGENELSSLMNLMRELQSAYESAGG